MKVERAFKYKGTLSVPRSILTLVNEKILTMNDLSWYLVFAMQTDFGHQYKTRGVITAGDKIVAKALKCDPTTVNKKRNKLIKVGLLKETRKDEEYGLLTEIANYEMFTGGRNSMVVPVTTKTLNEGLKETSELFQNEETYKKKCQEINEFQSHKLIQNS